MRTRENTPSSKSYGLMLSKSMKKIGEHTYKLKTLGGWVEPLPVNNQDLKFYFT